MKHRVIRAGMIPAVLSLVFLAGALFDFARHFGFYFIDAVPRTVLALISKLGIALTDPLDNPYRKIDQHLWI
jgi:hypothetical protein